MYLSAEETTTAKDKDKKGSALWKNILNGITSTAGSILNGIGQGFSSSMTSDLNPPSTTLITPEIKPDYTPLIIGGVGVVALLGVALFIGKR